MELLDVNDIAIAVSCQYAVYSCPWWILDVCFIPDSSMLLLGLSNNSIQIVSLANSICAPDASCNAQHLESTLDSGFSDVCTVRSESQTLLYSISIYLSTTTDKTHKDKGWDAHQEAANIAREPLPTLPNSRDPMCAIASGTPFGQVLIWRFMLDDNPIASAVPVFYRLQGHSGGILRCLILHVSKQWILSFEIALA